MKESKQQKGWVKSDKTLFLILDSLHILDKAGVTELAEMSDLPKSTVHKHLKALESEDYIINDGGKYELGFKFLTFGGRVRDNNYLCRIAESAVTKLRQETDQNATFAIEQGGLGIFTHIDRTRYSINYLLLGEQFHLSTTAVGKAMLATLSDKEVANLIEKHGLPRRTDATITDRENLHKELETIRDRGYALNMEERQEGIREVGTAVSIPDHNILGGISVAGPAHYLSESDLNDEYANAVLASADEIKLQIKHNNVSLR
ncbi:IclR family transcriptional regulator [Halalkalicoccus sp. NIPERK01]|uniref:IclR family transcriptional regulator n=1 Tax=Halalkalicoccus sp. NIPERK01 TaxID=3053469 RepID=UPI00256F1070|nr:IclR family transcriptional regulator [Halalkalicoccus sp. NIPERK01]MDL5363840.1 IclR family transcriptional regulator [Halalkalicoccus sp. NIPERK01]